MDTFIEKKILPLVSVLVPVYKVEQFIERCAISLFSQTYTDIEYIFVNDSTPDNSILFLNGVIERYPSRKNQIKIISHDFNKGIGAARNSLLQEATGEYLFWVDSDDYIESDAIERLVDDIGETNVDIITCNSYYFYKGLNNIQLFEQNLPVTSFEYIKAVSQKKGRAALWGTLSKRELWINNNIAIDELCKFGEDYFATIQLFFYAKTIIVSQYPFYYYNQTNINAYTRGYKSEFHFLSLNRLFDGLNSFFLKEGVFDQYSSIIYRAKVNEFSSLLLHTTGSLRIKYRNVISLKDLTNDELKADLTVWQLLILKQIILGHKFYVYILIFMAKIFRSLFGIRF